MNSSILMLNTDHQSLVLSSRGSPRQENRPEYELFRVDCWTQEKLQNDT